MRSVGDALVADRLRRFLLVVATAAGGAAIAELWFAEHTAGFVQILAFVFAGSTVVSAAASLVKPRRRLLLVHRLVMVVVIGGSGFGIYEHVVANLGFAMDIRPNATAGDVWYEGLTGASPALAPGILGLAALLGLAGTYDHPRLAKTADVDA
jgi:hypothetical protein